MFEIPIWRDGRAHVTGQPRQLSDYRGRPLAQIHEAPALLVHRVEARLQEVTPPVGESGTELWDAIARAADLLTGAELGGHTPAEFLRQITLATGVPLFWNEAALAELAAGLRAVKKALGWQTPGGQLGVLTDYRAVLPTGQSFAWVPAGRTLGFIAPSNHPAVHLTWVLALAMGYAVIVRPGADDPLTPWRLILALQAAGFPTERIALLPGGHDLVPAIVQCCDRAIAYGGLALTRLLGDDPRVLLNGPGHSKVLVDSSWQTAGISTAELADFLFRCISHDGGRKCTCASGILLRGPWPGLTAAVKERLQALPLLDPLDPKARVPARKNAGAAGGAPAQTTSIDGIIFTCPDLLQCQTPAHAPFGYELAAPWATAAEISDNADPLPYLRRSLAVTLLTTGSRLALDCLLEPTIAKVFTGPIPPWHTEPGAPHHGRLGEFLFTSKAFKEGAVP